jgi:uncharacterized membrane protein YphA (DoxX/SURF4 family)
MNTKRNDIIINIIGFLFITMFLYAAVSKWLIFDVFKHQIGKQPLNETLKHYLVWILPISEVIVSFLIMISKTQRLAIILATGMMILFTGYIILVQLHFYGEIPCSCGGAISEFTWTQHLYFNLFFVSAGIIAILLDLQKRKFKNIHK